MTGKTAFLFPGQGSQYVGMGKDFLRELPEAGRLFETAEKISGVPVASLCLEGPISELTKTRNLQPCLTAVDLLICKAVREAGIEAHAAAGHSLGEYPALWACGILNTEDVFRLVRSRGEFMEEAADLNPGAMAAVIGLDRDGLQVLVDKVTADAQGVLALANHNSREQIVVTGEKELVSKLCRAVKDAGKRAVPLKVSGAYHSPLMRPAADRFKEVLAGISFEDGRIPVYSNVTAEPEASGTRMRELMAEQICSPVRWFDIINNMYRDGVRTFIELGPKKVLTNLARKCLDAEDVDFFSVENPQDIANLLGNNKD